MATWTNIGDTFLEPGKPVRSVDGLALRDNPIAIAEGAAGAPKIRAEGLQPPAAGTANIIMRLQDSTFSTDSIAYAPVNSNNRHDSREHLGVTVLVPGVITAYFQHRSTAGGSTSARIIKNGAVVQAWTINTTAFQTRSVDIAVSVGDTVAFQQFTLSAAQSEWQNIRIYSANPDMAVA